MFGDKAGKRVVVSLFFNELFYKTNQKRAKYYS